ncbi:MAG: CPBP family intramembrane metalloprotease [Spirochaetaceae bacterium]|jgi:membrane protease YdiL (CAAX protease family)|nr:CPBP family intramembrane metalloprotease [Spirochaetaceae bacterium]
MIFLSKDISQTQAILTKVEPVLLYMLLFFPGVFAEGSPELFSFSIHSLANRIILFYLPALFVLWFLLFRLHSLKKEEIYPCRHDIGAFTAAFILLLCIRYFVNFFFPVDDSARIRFSGNLVQYCSMVFLFLCSGYLEEGYFRFYLLRKNQKPSMIIFSTALFALCHRYQGIAGMFNTACAGLLLSTVFIKSRSLHGIAIAHGLYNIIQTL